MNCKLCSKPRYANTSWCLTHYKKRQKENEIAKKQRKIEKHKTTKTYQKEVTDKLIKKADKLYQEIGRLQNKECYLCRGTYSCLHHFVRKSQSLNTRYDLDNGIPICVKCHCSIHQGENSELEGRIVQKKGFVWFDKLIAKKHTIITNKLEFVKSEHERLTNIYNALKGI